MTRWTDRGTTRSALLAARTGVEVIATNNVHYATPDRRRLATALAAIRSRRSLDELDGWLPATPFAHLRSAAEQERRFARYPGAVERTVDIAAACAFDLKVAVPNLPDYPVPDGHTDMSWLRELTRRGAAVYYPRTHEHYEQAMRQIDYELGVVEQLGFPGYFLLLHDIVEFCRTHDIYCQGRGSAANSAVCYALGVTKADAVTLGLLFERFLSTERDGPPDIDLDIEHQRREEVIQYVYEKYGRDRAAQVANVVTYRPKSALREMAKVAGLSPGHADAITRWIDRWRSREGAFDDFRESEDAPPVPELVLELADQVQDFPRHLGIHSGGMVMADRPLVECCPVEWARMENRSVLQWDKDDCAAAGLVKFDLLGLGMLTMLHLAVDLVHEHEDLEIDLATIPQEPEVYTLLCAADTIGVFQVESRAQMATLPRLRPEEFYDLVVEVALIRPGPIQGGSVHPYLRRRNGEEEVTYPHPILEPCLRKTLGVPLFQEQLMQMAIDAAGFSPGEADQLRQAMGSKRSKARMARMRDRLMVGMAERGITGATAEEIAHKLEAFASFGFPESHSVSFAYLVYASSWIKLHHPAEFACALLNAQPMGFYSPHTLVRDARRHGVEVLGPCIARSRRDCTLEPRSGADGPIGHPQPGWHTDPSIHAMRIGLRYVRGLSSALLDRIDEERARAPFGGLEDFARRTEAPVDALEAIATTGAFACFDVDRRAGLWAAGALRDARPEHLPHTAVGVEAPALPGMTDVEETAADLWATGLSPDRHPTEFVREELAARGVITYAEFRVVPARSVVTVAGVVTHRQQPETANGTVFLNLEDETGLTNVICPGGVWKRYRKVAAHVTRADGAGRGGALSGRHQPARPAHRGAAARSRRRPALPRLPLTGVSWRSRERSAEGDRHEPPSRRSAVVGEHELPRVADGDAQQHQDPCREDELVRLAHAAEQPKDPAGEDEEQPEVVHGRPADVERVRPQRVAGERERRQEHPDGDGGEGETDGPRGSPRATATRRTRRSRRRRRRSGPDRSSGALRGSRAVGAIPRRTGARSAPPTRRRRSRRSRSRDRPSGRQCVV